MRFRRAWAARASCSRYEHYGIEPDIFTLAKGLGSGFPVGAMLAKGELCRSLQRRQPWFDVRRNADCDGGGEGDDRDDRWRSVYRSAQRKLGDYLMAQLQEKLAGNPVVDKHSRQRAAGRHRMHGPVADMITEGQKRGLLVVSGRTECDPSAAEPARDP